MSTITRAAYADMFGPTTGDRVRLGDTDLIIEVEADRAIYGEEVKFGGGKVIRDGMGQSQQPRAISVDTVITNALIVDHWGIVKADVGITQGRSHQRPSARPVIPIPRLASTLPSGPARRSSPEKASILTAGGIDAHIHYDLPAAESRKH